MAFNADRLSLRTLINFLILLPLLLLLFACDEQPRDNKSSTENINKTKSDLQKKELQKPDLQKNQQQKIVQLDKNNKEIQTSNFKTQYKKIRQDDWAIIKQSGILRIIVPYSFQHNEFLPRESLTYNNELKLILRFCENNNLTPIFISTKSFSNMLPILQQGLGDIVVANLTMTERRKKQINFTMPVAQSVEQLVVARSFAQDKISVDELYRLKIGVRDNTSFQDTLQQLNAQLNKESKQQLNLIKLDDRLSPDEKFDLLIAKKVDAVVEDSNRLTLLKTYRKDIKTILDLGKERPIAWAVRKNNPQLLKQLNRYIRTEKLLQHLPETRLGDLDSIKKHRQLRLITRNNASTYFLWKNQLMGFEYELIREFAKQQKVNLKVLVASDFQQMAQWLEEGYGDIISAGLIKNPEREKLPIAFTEPYLFVQEIIVQRKTDKTIESTSDLGQRTFYVRKSSSYFNTLEKLQGELRSKNIHFKIAIVPESMETEEIIKKVIAGEYDLTLSDSHIIAIEQSWNNDLKASLALTGQHGHRWLIRKTDKKLLKALNLFIKKEYKKLFYNVTYNKYFKNSRKLFDVDKRDKNNKIISPYDDLIKKLAKEYNVDWRLVSAQVNKESQFNPKAKSWAGARGLLQVMPRTAREVGITDLEKPENGLRAGLKYMNWINEQLSNELPADVQIWFTLAAYNAGLGHLKDARRLTAQQGLNPDRWFGHVEKAFLLLSKPKYHKQARYGYVRGIEPVTYVKQIQALYELYSKKHPDEA